MLWVVQGLSPLNPHSQNVQMQQSDPVSYSTTWKPPDWSKAKAGAGTIVKMQGAVDRLKGNMLFAHHKTQIVFREAEIWGFPAQISTKA